MFVRSYSFHLSHQYTLHVIIIGGKTTHRRCLVLQCGINNFLLVRLATLLLIISARLKLLCLACILNEQLENYLIAGIFGGIKIW